MTVQITGVGAYTGKPFVYITRIYVNHRIIRKGWVGAYSREYGISKYVAKSYGVGGLWAQCAVPSLLCFGLLNAM